jgi:hypothetical protein
MLKPAQLRLCLRFSDFVAAPVFDIVLNVEDFNMGLGIEAAEVFDCKFTQSSGREKGGEACKDSCVQQLCKVELGSDGNSVIDEQGQALGKFESFWCGFSGTLKHGLDVQLIYIPRTKVCYIFYATPLHLVCSWQ